MIHLFYLLLILSEYFIHDNGDGTITGYIAGGAEAVHCNIEGYHERLHIKKNALLPLSRRTPTFFPCTMYEFRYYLFFTDCLSRYP
jgi:hypothetical protein